MTGFARWYQPHRRLELAVVSLLRAAGPEIPACLLLGPPGTGKSAAPTALAEGMGWELVAHQLHAWTDADELFVGIDVRAAVAGEAENVRMPGILHLAAHKSIEAAKQGKRVVVLLDEIDKATEQVENVLLKYLQDGLVPVRPGEYVATDPRGIVVFATTNETRPLGDAFLRRFRKVFMPPLPRETAVGIMTTRTAAPKAVCTLVYQACTLAAAVEDRIASLQEMTRCVEDTVAIAQNVEDVRAIVEIWATATEDGRKWVRESKEGKRLTGAIWGELRAWKGGEC